MKRIILSICLSFFAIVSVWGQAMSDAEVASYAAEQKKAGVSETDIASNLLQKGATMAQLQRLRQQFSKQIDKSGMGGTVDNALSGAENRMRVNNGETSQATIITNEELSTPIETTAFSGQRVFGRDIFNNKRLSFEPSMNIATPQNYLLGPGDQLIVDVYGASKETLMLTISPDGDVTIPECGPVHVSGLTVASAQNRIRSTMGKYYQTSSIKTTLGQTRTISVNVMGEVKVPGTYTLSAFSTVFHALYMAGGINDLGTLRSIKVVRQGKQISIVDIYEFILHGRLAGNVRLADNDVIQVGPYECIVEIGGRVKRPMAYEMRKDESLATLLEYSGGYTGDAYKKSIRLQRKNGKMKSVYNVEEFDLSSFKVEDGDFASVDSIYDRYENMVEIRGAVFRPGMYQLGTKTYSVRTLIENADGLTEEAMTNHAVLRRMKPNRTQEVLSIDIESILNGTIADVPLQNEDILFISTMAEHQNLRTLTIGGEVVFPGVFEFADNMTIEDLILQAGGLTDAASVAKVDVSRMIRDPKSTKVENTISKNYTFSVKDNFVIDGGERFILEPYDIVQVRRSPAYHAPSSVMIEGEVAFAGTYIMETKNQRLSDLVNAAGGVNSSAYVRGARLLRYMTEDERARMREIIELAHQNQDGQDSINLEKVVESNIYSVGIHLDEALAHPGGVEDIELNEGDRLIVPTYNHTIRISGDVLRPNTVAMKEGYKLKDYVAQAGGYGARAKKRQAFIVYQNGTMAKASKGKIEPGCEIVVPTKQKKDSIPLAQWLGIGSTAASLGTMAAAIVNISKK
ncbi:MAG: SLBB domain-containing protein [Bacteroidaceae bacterium]|nr:SLBB domain-containing protein [Bacteroidaceae bacterium]